ncbi:hypothetical protein SDC9_53740 [bioreactor metagenome]|uniref:Uncharacterized protein n=1 Tax=bioreactor metagenome TaxID=1076179 RepID=A0A644WZS7_9ZZZZ
MRVAKAHNPNYKQMNMLLLLLSQKPEIGLLSSICVTLVSIIQNLTIWLQLLGILLGVGVAVLTIIAKLLEIKKLRKQNEKNRK